MSENLTVPKDKVIKAYNEAKTSKRKSFLENIFGKKVFVPDVMERINSLDDVFKETGKSAKDYVYTGNDPDKIMLNATAIALLISRAFNEGKEADWANSNQPKYFIWQKYSPSVGWSLCDVDLWFTNTGCGARLCFLNKEHALKAYELFGKEVYQKINYLIP
jgi:hypothetical protein